MKFFSLLVASSALLQLALCQPQCQNLDVENNGQAMTGRDLTFCRNDSAQCCLQNYINIVESMAMDRLGLGLRLQMRETSVTFNNTIAMIRNYFAMNFRESFVGSIPTVSGVTFDELNATAGAIATMFVQNLPSANATMFIERVSNAIGQAAGGILGNGSEQMMCVRQLILNNVNQSDVAMVIRGLMTVQRGIRTLDRIADFLYRYRMNTQFMFPARCVQRFVELNFCARCTRRIPPLCSNTCGALFRGCLSPYYTVLSRQFDILWNVSRQVLRITNDTLQDLFMNQRSLVDIAQIAQQIINGQCPGVRLPLGKRQANRNTRVRYIPQQRMQELRDLNGRGFTYNVGGENRPIICRPSDEEVTFCANPRMRAENEYCNATMACTSSCRCFDGMNARMTNTDQFTMNGIDGQGDNPAIDLMESELMTIVTSIGSPSSAFLMQSDFTADTPAGVVIPSDEDDSGAAHVTMSTVALLLTVVAAVFL